MLKIEKSLFLILIFCIFVSPIFAFDVSSTDLHLHLTGLKEASAPIFIDDHLVLSVSGNYRYVGASFSYENWKTTHSFEKNEHGVFVLAIPVPFGKAQTVSYRLVVDGLWMTDPMNNRFSRDYNSGVTMSMVDFPERSDAVLGYWKPESPGMANFCFFGEPNKTVTVTGSFNAWDPFIYEMEEVSPGKYCLSLRMSPGEYYYAFVYKGEKIPDPLNGNTFYNNRNGTAVSKLIIPEN